MYPFRPPFAGGHASFAGGHAGFHFAPQGGPQFAPPGHQMSNPRPFHSSVRRGDWLCNACTGHNYSRNMCCYRCSAPKWWSQGQPVVQQADSEEEDQMEPVQIAKKNRKKASKEKAVQPDPNSLAILKSLDTLAERLEEIRDAARPNHPPVLRPNSQCRKSRSTSESRSCSSSRSSDSSSRSRSRSPSPEKTEKAKWQRPKEGEYELVRPQKTRRGRSRSQRRSVQRSRSGPRRNKKVWESPPRKSRSIQRPRDATRRRHVESRDQRLRPPVKNFR